MPADEIIGEVAAFIGRNAVGLVSELVFSKYGARYFHGIGRRIIMLATVGRLRILSSLRQVPKGEMPKPEISDWFALLTGVGVWLASAGTTIFYVFA